MTSYRAARLIRGASAILAGIMLAAPVQAQDPASGEVVLLPFDVPIGNYNGSEPVVGPAQLHIAGAGFKAGNGWWILSCAGQGCRLDAASLAVKPSTHPQYDGPPVASQRLTWSARPRVRASLLAAFKPKGALAQLSLRPGPLSTWFHHRMATLPPLDGPLPETRLDMDGGRHALLRQRLVKGAGDTVLELELATEGKVQQLGRYEFHMSEPGYIAPQMVVMWAGDLDGDGKLDLLVNNSAYYWDTTLYLSSLAKPGELVAPAGRFQYAPPDSGGC